MKKILNKIKKNILICDLIFIIFNILLNFTLYIINIRFRLWVIIIIILISLIGFISGLIQQIFFFTQSKKIAILLSLFSIILLLTQFVLFLPIIGFIAIFKYKPEHTTTLDNKKYVAVVNSFLNVDVDYYEYYGAFLMGTNIKVHGDFGKGGFDPIANPNIADGVIYTYYDQQGKVTSKRSEIYFKDETGQIISKDEHDININKKKNNNNHDNYLLPEDAKVLYEKKFDDTILRFSQIDTALGQKILVKVIRSKDNGQNFYYVTDNSIQVNNNAKYEFLTKDNGFIANERIYLDGSKEGLIVTNDGGKTFQNANFTYKKTNVEYITIQDLPYYQDNILKIKCAVYQRKKDDSGYENKELIFTSNDNGFNWNLENN